MYRVHKRSVPFSGPAARRLAAAMLAGFAWAAGAELPAASIRYLGENRLSGLSAAVVVEGHALAHTAQLLPLDGAGRVVGEGSVDAQLAQALFNLESALAAAGTDTDHLVKINFYVDSPKTASAARGMLDKRFRAPVRPAFSWVVTRLPHPQAILALDAVAAVPGGGPAGVVRCAGPVAAGQGAETCAAVLPIGDAVYVSGWPEKGDLQAAAAKSLEGLLKTLQHAGLDCRQVVHVKVFLRAVDQAAAVRGRIAAAFAGQPLPPLTFVEWAADLPVEIELIAAAPRGRALPPSGDTVSYFTPPGIPASPLYSRVARAHAGPIVYLSGLYAEKPGDGEAQVRDIFRSLQESLRLAGSDLRHLVKATYYCTDKESSDTLNTIRAELYDPRRAPAASKAAVRGVATADRSIAVDMIAVPAP